ncbi:MAG: ATP-dependent sacrificial sulfur transferase LarE [Oscillospiraceae bacterium]|nr:ATP-dependent sacrificial sulfur transferase LarE [Oscillospiraceae bacterium]
MTARYKLERLRALLAGSGPLAVAFSGGTDSSFLLQTAQDLLGEGVLALTADSVFIPRAELEEAASFCRERGIRQKTVRIDVLRLPGVGVNPPDRCYLCKRAIFERLRAEAAAEGFSLLADGSNADDAGDYRPGMRALRELGVCSPLLEASLTKAEIRELSKARGLPGWDKPSAACLASRIAYGEALTEEKLRSVERGEALLHSLGFPLCRVRVHGTLARIELPPEEFGAALENRRTIADALKELGFLYVTLDMTGFRSGSMNDALR